MTSSSTWPSSWLEPCLLLRAISQAVPAIALKAISRAIAKSNNVTHHEKKPRGSDRRGFYNFAWINERRSGKERRAVKSDPPRQENPPAKEEDKS